MQQFITPPFISSGVLPNILIILGNSNSMDEDFYQDAVGSYAPTSKSVVAKQALQNLITNLQGQANVGIMTYSLPSDVQAYSVHNAMPFSSYDPNSYCPNAPPDCAAYCTTGSAASATACNAVCGAGFTSHIFATGTNFPDAILSTSVYAFNEPTGTRARYCSLIYPKTLMWQANSTSPPVYYSLSDPMYANANLGTAYGYCGSDEGSNYKYSTAENASNNYGYWFTKSNNQNDTFSGGGLL